MGNSISVNEFTFGWLIAGAEPSSYSTEPYNNSIHLIAPLGSFMDPHFLSLFQSPFSFDTITISNEELLIDMLKLSTEISISYMKRSTSASPSISISQPPLNPCLNFHTSLSNTLCALAIPFGARETEWGVRIRSSLWMFLHLGRASSTIGVALWSPGLNPVAAVFSFASLTELDCFGTAGCGVLDYLTKTLFHYLGTLRKLLVPVL